MEANSLVGFLKGKHWLTEVLSENDLKTLLSKSTIVTYRKRETIAKRGEFIVHIPLLLQGYTMIELDDGKRNVILDIYKDISIIGLPVLLSVQKYIFSIITLTEAEVAFLPVDFFLKSIENNGKLAKAVLDESTNTFVIPMIDKLKSVSQNNIRGRLAKLILYFANNIFHSDKFTLLTSRTEMAQMIGFSRENVIRILTEFDEEGIIKVKSKSIEVIDSFKLEELAKYS